MKMNLNPLSILLLTLPAILCGSVAVAQPGIPNNCACPVPGVPTNLSGYSPAPLRIPRVFGPAPFERPRLRQGEDIRQAQRQLARLGYDVGTPDGVFGAATDSALRRFQASNGLKADGVLGPSTVARLNERAGNSNASSLTIKRKQTEDDQKPERPAAATASTSDPDTAVPTAARKSSASQDPVSLDAAPTKIIPKAY